MCIRDSADTGYPDPRGELDPEADPGLLYAGQWQDAESLSLIHIYWKTLKQYLNSYHPDVVHCLGLYSALVLVKMCIRDRSMEIRTTA